LGVAPAAHDAPSEHWRGLQASLYYYYYLYLYIKQRRKEYHHTPISVTTVSRIPLQPPLQAKEREYTVLKRG